MSISGTPMFIVHHFQTKRCRNLEHVLGVVTDRLKDINFKVFILFHYISLINLLTY